MPLNPGDLLNNRYRIKDILGQGGMGYVYHAFDENLSIDVAVKENLFLSNEYGKQFQREANILASLRHPNLPHVIDYMILPGQGQYLIMDYIDGEDLRQRLERVGKLSEEEMVLIGAAICEALSYLHSRIPPIIHRDIKPGNIKITPDGDIFLVDFGLAKILLGNQATSTGARAMTPGYSPPEQYGSAPTDARSDVYALGATLYAAITGTIPEDALARAMGKASLTPIKKYRADLSQPLADVIEKALATEPDDRFQTAELFQQALLESCNIAHTPHTRITVDPAPLPQPNSSHKNVRANIKSITTPGISPAWLIGGIVVILAFIAYLALRPSQSLNIFPWLDKPTATPLAVTLPTEQILPTADRTSPVITVLPTAVEKTPTPMPTATVLVTPVGSKTGQLAFASDRSGIMQIWIMNSDGSDPQQITDLTEGACQPAWSPNGKIIAFISPCFSKQIDYARAHIYLLDLEVGGNPTLAPIPSDPAGDYDPTFSSDGKKLAFTSLRKNLTPNIFVYDFNTNRLTNYSAEDKIERHPAWSPDGEWLAYVRGSANTEIWIVRYSSGQRERYTVASQNINAWPAWSLDSKMLYYTQFENGQAIPRLIGLRFDDRNVFEREFKIPQTLATPIGPVVEVSLSPDGQWFSYEGWPDGFNHDIYIMTANGARPTRLTTEDTFEFGAVWRPDPAQ